MSNELVVKNGIVLTSGANSLLFDISAVSGAQTLSFPASGGTVALSSTALLLTGGTMTGDIDIASSALKSGTDVSLAYNASIFAMTSGWASDKTIAVLGGVTKGSALLYSGDVGPGKPGSALLLTGANFAGGPSPLLVYAWDDGATEKGAQIDIGNTAGFSGVLAIGDGAYRIVMTPPVLSTDISIAFPNTNGIFALTSDIIDPAGVYLPLAGGTMTGNITMTTAGWVGIGSSAGRIIFTDASPDMVTVSNANLVLDAGSLVFDTGTYNGNLASASITTADKTWTLPDATGNIPVVNGTPSNGQMLIYNSANGYYTAQNVPGGDFMSDGSVAMTASIEFADAIMTGLNFNQTTGAYTGALSRPVLGANRSWVLPDATGTIALTSDIPAVVWLPTAGGTMTGDITLNASDLIFDTGSFNGNLVSAAITTADKTWTLPDATGTVALTSDLSAYLPLAGGTMAGNITMGTNSVLFGVTGSIYGTSTTKTAGVETNASGTTAILFARNSAGNGTEVDVQTTYVRFIKKVLGDSNRTAYFDLSSITAGADRFFTLPNATGTIAITNDLSAYLPLAGGTMSGDITMTSTKWIGIGASAGRFVFTDAATDTVTLSNANLVLDAGSLVFDTGSFNGNLVSASITTADKTWTLPNNTGTVAVYSGTPTITDQIIKWNNTAGQWEVGSPTGTLDHSALTNKNWAAAGHTIDATLDMNNNFITEVSKMEIIDGTNIIGWFKWDGSLYADLTVGNTAGLGRCGKLLVQKTDGTATLFVDSANDAVSIGVGCTFSIRAAGGAEAFIAAANSTTQTYTFPVLGGRVAVFDNSTPPTDNQVLKWSAGSGTWLPGAAPGDNLGNHTATTNLSMATFNINNVDEITLRQGASIQNKSATGITSAIPVAIDSFAASGGDACVWHYVIKRTDSVGNLRSGTVTAVWDGTSSIKNIESSTESIGDTSAVTLSAEIVGGTNIQLKATVTGGTWTVRAIRNMI